jgi:hypothetical protein
VVVCTRYARMNNSLIPPAYHIALDYRYSPLSYKVLSLNNEGSQCTYHSTCSALQGKLRKELQGWYPCFVLSAGVGGKVWAGTEAV